MTAKLATFTDSQKETVATVRDLTRCLQELHNLYTMRSPTHEMRHTWRKIIQEVDMLQRDLHTTKHPLLDLYKEALAELMHMHTDIHSHSVTLGQAIGFHNVQGWIAAFHNNPDAPNQIHHALHHLQTISTGG